MFKRKLVQIGKSLGFTLPKEVIASLRLKEGDDIVISGGPRGYRFNSHDPVARRQLKAARKVMKSRRVVLRELAK